MGPCLRHGTPYLLRLDWMAAIGLAFIGTVTSTGNLRPKVWQRLELHLARPDARHDVIRCVVVPRISNLQKMELLEAA